MKISRSPAGRPASKKKQKKKTKKKDKKKRGWTRSIIPIKAEPIFTSLIVWSR